MSRRFVAAIAAACILALAGCASKPVPHATDRIILLPSETGKPSSVVVTTRSGEVVLASPYSAVEITDADMVKSERSREETERQYQKLLAAQARAPKVFTMFFVLGTDEFTPASRTAFEEVRKEIALWPGAEVVVIGHTDRMGTVEFNDALARKRADSVAARLVSTGVAANRITVTSRGEREPLILTADGVPEPRNRRVEIKVR